MSMNMEHIPVGKRVEELRKEHAFDDMALKMELGSDEVPSNEGIDVEHAEEIEIPPVVH